MPEIGSYRGGSQKTLNEINASVVLDRIRNGGLVTRASLGKELSLSAPTISRIVDALIQKDYVLEVGPGKSTGGKRPTILRFKAERDYVLGIGVDVDFIDMILSDMAGNVVKKVSQVFHAFKHPAEMVDLLQSYVEQIVHEAGLPIEKVKAVSIGVPATVDSRNGLVTLCPTIPVWQGVNLTRVIGERIQKDVLISNIATLSLLGELWKGAARGHKNVVLVSVGTGIGASILLDGKVLQGANGSIGEIGYMYIDRKMDRKSSYPFGQFEYLASNIAFRRSLTESESMDPVGEGLDRLMEDESTQKKLFDIVDNFSYGVANLICTLNPELVVVRGALLCESQLCLSRLIQNVNELIPFKARIVKSALKDDAICFGAIRLALDYLDKKLLSPFFSSRIDFS